MKTTGRIALSCAFVAHLAWTAAAAADATVETHVSARRVEVRQVVTLQLNVSSDSGARPSNAKLTVPPGVRAEGPQLGMQMQVRMSANGQRQQRNSFTLSWTLSIQNPGKYRIGPASAEIDGQRVSGQPVSIEVLPEGTSARPGRGRGSLFPFDPFDPFGGLGGPRFPGFPGFPSDDAEPEPAPSIPPEYEIERIPDPIAFVVAKAAPRKAVLGQAISYKIYTYGGREMYGAEALNEPSRDGFLAYMSDPGTQVHAFPLRFDSQIFIAAKLREIVLVPIRVGNLRIGPMRVGFKGPKYPASPGAQALLRESQPIDIQVVEPPLEGRPVGYRFGDVGRYKLEANVEPRSIRQGEGVSVIAKLEGVGNLPAKLDLPQQNGVEWMDPTTIEKLDVKEGELRGSRTFTYVVRFERPGSVDLGDLALPYYDPSKRRYEVARASLGRVSVQADPAASNSPQKAAPADDRLHGLLTPRSSLEKLAPPPGYLLDRAGALGWLLGGPLSVLAGSGLLRLVRSASRRLGARHATPARRAEREIEAAREAERRGDLAATAAAVERALHLAIEARTSLKARGFLRAELGSALIERGIPAQLSQRIVELFSAAEEARFVQGDVGARAVDLRERGRAAVADLMRSRS